MGWFEQLAERRRRGVEAIRENNWEKGIRQSTVEKYPDETHFVYELLQNAEDQEATAAIFELYYDRLVFRHRGLAFTPSDVENITGLGNSDKETFENKIGRFGIGFKSVFVITDRPEVYTSIDGKPFGFAIEDLVAPIRVSGDMRNTPDETCFVFPFAEQNREERYTAILNKLRALGADTMLFLSHLQEITWEAGHEHGYFRCDRGPIERLDHDTTMRYVTLSSSDQDTQSYLNFSQRVEVEEETDRRLEVSLAYCTYDGAIVPAPGREVLYVYFPTEEQTRWAVRMHAPMYLTDNRANIKSDNSLAGRTNRFLIRCCADLLLRSALTLRDRHLLTVSVIEDVFPIRPDDFTGRLFDPLYQVLREAFLEHALLPTAEGDYIDAKHAILARGGDLVKVFSNCMMTSLRKEDELLRWLSTEITKDSCPRLYPYLTGVRRATWQDYSIKPLVDNIEVTPDDVIKTLTDEFFKALDDDQWLVSFYRFMRKHRDLHRRLDALSFIRLQDGRYVKRVNQHDIPNAYLPYADGRSSGLPTVRRSLLADEEARSFLVEMGISEPNIIDRLQQQILQKYRYNRVAPSDIDQYCADIEYIYKVYNSLNEEEQPELIQILNDTPILLCESTVVDEQHGKQCSFKRPSDCFESNEFFCIYLKYNSETWFDISCDVFVDREERLCAEGSSDDDSRRRAVKKQVKWITILNKLSVIREISAIVKTIPANYRGEVIRYYQKEGHLRGIDKFDPRATVSGLDTALQHCTPECARLIWNQIIVPHSHLVYGTVHVSSQKTFREYKTVSMYSDFGRILFEYQWIQNSHNQLVNPGDMQASDLPEGYLHNVRLESVLLGQRYSERIQAAKQLGFSDEIASAIADESLRKEIEAFVMKRMKKNVEPPSNGAAIKYTDALSATMTQHAGSQTYREPADSMPLSPVANPERRREKVSDEIVEDKADEPTTQERVQYSVSVRWEPKNEQTRLFLREEYNGCCQICSATFPKRDGSPYFEGVYLVSYKEARWLDRPGNVLCLCPTCAAKWMHGSLIAPDFQKQIMDLRVGTEGGGSRTIQIGLCGDQVSISYSERHLIYLQEIIRLDQSEPIETTA